MKQKERGLGSLIYMEWLFPIKDYYCCLRKNEWIYEIIIPLVVAALCSVVYYCNQKTIIALDKLAEFLPTVISILIGFTVMLITLLLTSSGDNVEILKKTYSNKMLYKKRLTLYQGLHIQFSHSLFSEISLLLIIFLFLFSSGIENIWDLTNIFLFIEIYLTLNILLSILRGVTSIYFSFFRNTE